MNYDSSDPSTDVPKPGDSTFRTKKIIASIIAVGLLLVGALFIYAMLVYPAKQPYRDAYAQYLNVKNANIVLTESGASINGASATNEQFKKNIDTVKKAIQTLVSENDALAKVVVLQDGEGKQMYQAFNKKLQAYVAYNEAVVASIEQLRPVLQLYPDGAVTEKGLSIATNQARLCAQKLGTLQLPDADYDTMASKYSVIYHQLAEKVDAGNTDEATVLVDELSAVVTDFRESLRTHQAEVDITEKAMALDAYLDTRARIFSL